MNDFILDLNDLHPSESNVKRDICYNVSTMIIFIISMCSIIYQILIKNAHLMCIVLKLILFSKT